MFYKTQNSVYYDSLISMVHIFFGISNSEKPRKETTVHPRTLKIPAVDPKDGYIGEDPGEDSSNVYHRKTYRDLHRIFSQQVFLATFPWQKCYGVLIYCMKKIDPNLFDTNLLLYYYYFKYATLISIFLTSRPHMSVYLSVWHQLRFNENIYFYKKTAVISQQI